MANTIPDEAFARATNEMGAATFVQIETAKQVQKEKGARGIHASVADVLVEQGILTAAMRENIEKKVQAQQAGGIQRLGQYKLLKKLGEGGMGAVYLADDTALGRKVALKVLPKSKASNAAFLSRFHRECRAAAKLNHVNIAGAHTVGEELGLHFLVMEYCQGEPLDKLLKTQPRLPWDKAVEIVMQVVRGLKHAHEHGFIHRDIKPANIILTPEGVAKILDLGLAKQLGDSEESFHTQTGMAVGTPHYISPEQARGDKAVDCRTDIYSLGATFYHLVTGQTPFHGSTGAAIMLKHLNEQLTNPQDLVDDLPDGVAHVIMRMMAKDPADRYRDCAELLQDLELVIDGQAPSSETIVAAKSSVAMAKRAAATGTPRPAGARGQTPTGPQTAVAARGQGAARLGKAREAQDRSRAERKRRRILVLGTAAGVVLAGMVAGLAVLVTRNPPPVGNAADKIAAGPSADEQRQAEESRQTEEARLKAAAKLTAEREKLNADKRKADEDRKALDAAKLRADLERKKADEAAKGHPPSKSETTEPPAKGETPRKDTEPNAAAVAAAAAKQRAARAQELFRAVLKDTAPLLKENKLAEATALLDQKLKDPSLADAAELMMQERADIEAITELRKAAVEALRKLVGKEVMLSKGGTAIKGKVVKSPKEDAVAVDMGGAQVTFGAMQLSPEDVDQYAPQMENAGEDQRRRGYMWLAAGNFSKARGFFAKPDTVNAKAYLDRTTEPDGAAVEEAALRAWERAEQLFAAKDMPGAKAAYEAFERDHGKTQTAAKQAAALKERYAAIEKVTGQTLTPTLTLDLGGGVKMEFVLIPAGKFLMGSPSEKKDLWDNYGPQHEVTISKPFYMGRFEVTQGQYVRLVGRNPSECQDGVDAPRRAVERVSWKDAQAFLKKLNESLAEQLGNKVARLPTEAEWEYACRAGTRTRYCFGDAEASLGGFGWFNRNSGRKAHPVGTRKPNAWGLYDMHGNVAEWCQDFYARKYEPGPAVDPQGPKEGSERVIRGGSVDYGPIGCQSASRQFSSPGDRCIDTGFRVAVSPKSP